MLARLTDGDEVHFGEVWPVRLAWLRAALRDGMRSRKQIAAATGRSFSWVSRRTEDARDLGLIRPCNHGFVLVHQEGKR